MRGRRRKASGRRRTTAGRHRRRSQGTLMLIVGTALFLIVLADRMGLTNHG